MTPKDLQTIKIIQTKVQAYNSTHKQIKLKISEEWNSFTNRYDYAVTVSHTLELSNPRNARSVAKAEQIASYLTSLSDNRP